MDFSLKWTWIIMLFSALCDLAEFMPFRYHFVNINKVWTKAQSYCRQTYTDLATINNAEEMNKLKSTVEGKVEYYAWTGLEKGDGQKWQWSLRDNPVYDNWRSGEPNNGASSNSCVNMNLDGTWNDDNCLTSFSFVCYTGQKTANNLVLISEKKTYAGAQSYCRKNYRDLPSVKSITDNQKVQQAAGGNTVWIGLFRESWKWSDQSNSVYRSWRSGQPDDLGECCVALGKNITDHWDDWNCETSFPFICYENKLILIQQNLSWADALRYCRENHVDLVSVHSEEIQLWVKDVAQKASTDHVWLGMRHTCTQGFWYWVTGFSVCYDNWAPGNGTEREHCEPVVRTGAVQARGDQQWVSLPENQTLNFICIKYKG